MNKKILLLLLLFTQITFSQENFKPADSATTWRGVIINYAGGFAGPLGVHSYITDYDTVISTQTYTKLYNGFYEGTHDYYCSFRADTIEKAIFVVPADSTSEILFFDFDAPLALGDVLPLTFYDYGWYTQDFTYIGLETIYIDGEPYKNWYFYDYGEINLCITERMISYPFPFYPLYDFETEYRLKCYSENGIHLYGYHCPFTDEDGDLVSAIPTNPDDETNFTIYPNPSKGDFTFNNNSEYFGLNHTITLLNRLRSYFKNR